MKEFNHDLIEHFSWRYATKKFDNSKKVPAGDLDELLELMRLSASSYGLQPFKIIVIENIDLRKKLQTVSWNQPQIVDASHLFVFCHKTGINDEYIDDYLKNISDTREVPIESLKGFGDVMKEKLSQAPDSVNSVWSSRQVYLTLGTLLFACSLKKIDACPMEGFIPEKYDEILNLKEKGYQSVCLAAIGYRSDSDEYQHYKKVRRSKEDLYEFL